VKMMMKGAAIAAMLISGAAFADEANEFGGCNVAPACAVAASPGAPCTRGTEDENVGLNSFPVTEPDGSGTDMYMRVTWLDGKTGLGGSIADDPDLEDMDSQDADAGSLLDPTSCGELEVSDGADCVIGVTVMRDEEGKAIGAAWGLFQGVDRKQKHFGAGPGLKGVLSFYLCTGVTSGSVLSSAIHSCIVTDGGHCINIFWNPRYQTHVNRICAACQYIVNNSGSSICERAFVMGKLAKNVFKNYTSNFLTLHSLAANDTNWLAVCENTTLAGACGCSDGTCAGTAYGAGPEMPNPTAPTTLEGGELIRLQADAQE